MYKQIKLYLFTLSLLTTLTFYYTDLSGIKNFLVQKTELARSRHEKGILIKQQQSIPTLPNEAFIKNHHELVNGKMFTLPTYISQSSVEKKTSLIQEEPKQECRGSPSVRAP
jgi:hypothetical protein